MERGFFIALAVVMAIALGLSYYVEYGMGIPPCTLCKMQRYSYLATGVLSLLGIFFLQRPILRAAQLILLFALGVAIYHTSIELSTSAPSCSCGKDLSWTIFGLPAPLYGGVLSLALLVATQLFARKMKKWR